MGRDWWLLPGPADFLQRAADELREGRNLVLALPRHLPEGLAEALRARRFPDGEGATWLTLAATSDGRTPARQVAERVLAAVPPGLVDVSWLAHHPQLDGQVLWLEDLTPKTWPSWRDFLQEYAHDCRSRSLLERLLVVAPLTGPVAARPPQEDVALAVHRWADVVEPLDQLLYVWRLLRHRPMPRLQRDVFAAVVAGLALWDPNVSHALAELSLDEVLRPNEVLAELARGRSWAGLADGPEGWQEGVVEHFGGEERMHSAALAVAGDTPSADELYRRVWSAQVGVLLPYVERRRRELLERLDGQLTGPFHFADGLVIQDRYDLEIGQIAYQLAQRGRKVPRVVGILKQVRNALAHLEVVSAKLLNHGDLTRAL